MVKEGLKTDQLTGNATKVEVSDEFLTLVDKDRIAELAKVGRRTVDYFYDTDYTKMRASTYEKILVAHLQVLREKKERKEELDAMKVEAAEIQEQLKN